MSYNTIHVHGAFAPEIALNGNLGTLVPFGLTMEETTLTPTAFFEDVKADASGAGISDIQFLGAECLIRMTLIRWDEGLLSSIRARLNGLTDGIIPWNCIGTLLGAGGYFMGLRLPASQRCGLPAELPWTFPTVTLVGDSPLTIGTRTSRVALTFRAVNYTGVLFTRS